MNLEFSWWRLSLTTWTHWCYAHVYLPLLSDPLQPHSTLLFLILQAQKNIWERRLLTLVVNIPPNRIWVDMGSCLCFLFISLMRTACTVPYSFCNVNCVGRRVCLTETKQLLILTQKTEHDFCLPALSFVFCLWIKLCFSCF